MKSQEGISTALVILLIGSLLVAVVLLAPKHNNTLDVKRDTTAEDTSKKEPQETVYKLKVVNVEGESIWPFGLKSDREGDLYKDGTYIHGGSENILYTIAEANSMKIGDVINKGSLKINVVSEEPKLLPFLKDAKYCETDADCNTNGKYCDIGSYNQYANFVTFGCTALGNIEGYTKEDLNNLGCPTGLMGKPMFSVKSIAHKCVDDRCTAESINLECDKP